MIIRSSLEYDCFVFAGVCDSLLSKLERIQLQAIRLALGYRNSTPSNIMLAEAHESTLQIRFSMLTRRYLLRVLSQNRHPVIRKLKYLNDIAILHTRYNILNSFILLKCLLALRNYKNLIKSYAKAPTYLVSMTL